MSSSQQQNLDRQSPQRDSAEQRSTERRKHWRDRRVQPDRRSLARQQQSEFDCRSGIPRRASDLAGELAEGELWWEKESDR